MPTSSTHAYAPIRGALSGGFLKSDVSVFLGKLGKRRLLGETSDSQVECCFNLVAECVVLSAPLGHSPGVSVEVPAHQADLPRAGRRLDVEDGHEIEIGAPLFGSQAKFLDRAR